MKRIFTFIATVILIVTANAETFSYRFSSITLPKAIQKIMADHPDLDINFIYNELENYKTNSTVNADNAYDALRQLVGLNPVTVTKSKDTYYVEALQHGKYVYTGRVIGNDNEPVVAATVMLLAPKDSTVLTYGITDDSGRFSIPCDHKRVLAKLSCIGFKTTYKSFESFNVGTVIMSEKVLSLNQVIVEGRTQYVIDRGSVYIPSKKMKRAAINATDLLALMNIPQLDVTPGSTSVKTYTGKDVGMFIDNKAATIEDLQGLRPEDVIRVEILQYPDDPRFGGLANVINFVMRKYEWGGYTKLTATGNTLNLNKGEGRLYSKYVKGNWTFDASATGSITHNNNSRSNRTETFRNINIGDQHYDEIIRTTKSGDSSLQQSNSQSVSFRATYQTKSTEIRHSVVYSRIGNPLTRSLSEVNYSEDVFSASSAQSKESGQTISPYFLGYYYFALPKDHSLLASWSFSYGSTRRNSSYMLGELPPIINNNKEESYAPVVSVQYSKKFSHKNTFRASLTSYNTIYHTQYDGSYNGLQKLLSSENMMFLEYMQNWQSGLSLYSRLGVSYVIGRLNGINTLEQCNPRLGLELQYKINDRNSASIEGWWGNNHPTPASSNSAIVQSNELLWLQGNPGLRNTTYTTASASYTYIPTNKFNISASAEYNGYLNKTAYQYLSLEGYDGLIRKEINNGDFFDFSGYLSATLKLFDNSLSLRASGKIAILKSTGIEPQSMNVITANLQANYYFKNFSFILYYQSPTKNIAPYDNGISRSYKSMYSLLVNYSIGDFKLGLQFRNWFDKYKYFSNFDSERYSAHGWQWNSTLARSIRLNLSYTLPYGKKVKRNNEIQTSIESNSAILK